MSNNDIMKKLRVALQLRDDDIVHICSLVNFNTTKTELGAIFRDKEHPNFKLCGDQSYYVNFFKRIDHLQTRTDGEKAGSEKAGSIMLDILFRDAPIEGR